jgi:hypothetical protein
VPKRLFAGAALPPSHGLDRISRLSPNYRFLATVAVLFTWYGVNFVLGRGMHAYGSGAGGEAVVFTAVLLQLLFVFAATVRTVLESQEPPSPQ